MTVHVNYPVLSPELRLRRLAGPAADGGPVRLVLDTDTYNEIDDQFAVIYALLSPERVKLEAFHAAPFFNELSSGPADGMEKSYRELLKIMQLVGRDDIPVRRGSERYIERAGEAVDSEAARALVELAMAVPDDGEPLYVAAIGAATNVSSAILMEPGIVEKIVVVWLGGHALNWPDTTEFNLFQDLHASRVLFDSGVPLIQVPCLGVASHLITALSEIREYVKPSGALGAYLYETFEACMSDHYGRSRVIWDISTIAWLVNEAWVPSPLVHSPRISEDFRWSFDLNRHLIRSAVFVNRDAVFGDFFRKLAAYQQ